MVCSGSANQGGGVADGGRYQAGGSQPIRHAYVSVPHLGGSLLTILDCLFLEVGHCEGSGIGITAVPLVLPVVMAL